MNKRQVVILWVIAIALGLGVAAVKVGQRESAASATKRAPGQTLFESFPDTDVAAIELEGAENRTVLRKAEGGWVVANRDDYPAETSRIHEFLRTLGELQVTQGIEAGPSFAPRFGMDPDASAAEEHGVAATFKDASGEALAEVSFGKNIEGASSSPFGGGTAGRFVRNHADESGFYAVNEMFPGLTAEPQRWLQEGFITVEKIKSVSVTEAGGDEAAWKVVRDDENADFSLASGVGQEAANTTATAPLKNLFSYARFNDLIPRDEVDERIVSEEKRTAVIETFEGFTYTVHFAPLREDEQPELAEGEGPPPAEESYYISVEVEAELPAERKKEEGETEDDAKTKDAAFTERHKTLSERLAKEQKLAGRAFEVSKYTVDALLKSRADLAASGANTTPAPAGTTATTRPIEAVTPPIAIPPLEPEPTDEGDAEEEGDEEEAAPAGE